MMFRFWITLGLALLASNAQADLKRAMQDELDRSMDRLALEGLERPYYLAYYAYEELGHTVRATLGAVLEDASDESRTGYVELRVGSPDLDNSNFFRSSRSPAGQFDLPLDADYDALRRVLWLETDIAYKDAVEILAKKEAALRSKTREEVADFTLTPAAVSEGESWEFDIQPDEAKALATSLSARLRGVGGIHRSEIEVNYRMLTTRMLNSEGSWFERREPRVSVYGLAVTQAEDGMELRDGFSLHARDMKSLPDLEAAVDQLGSRLSTLRSADLVDRYNGPVWFTAEAAAKLFALKFAPALANKRRPLVENSRFDPFSREGFAPLQGRVGGRVLPRSVEVVDDPTRLDLDGVPLLGSYQVDDDGVQASPTTVIQRGRLRTLLSTRNPSAQVAASTGNRRGGFGMPSNLIVRSSDTQSDRDFRKEFQLLLEEAELDYGIIVRDIGELILSFEDERPAFDESVHLTEAVMVDRDGNETPVRNLVLGGFGPSGFRDLIAIGKDPAVVHSPMRASPVAFGRLPSIGGPRLLSVAVPAMLFEELSLSKPEGEVPTAPALDPPSR